MRAEPDHHEVHRLRGLLRAARLTDVRVLYCGPSQAGVGTSVTYLAHVMRAELEPFPRYRFEHFLSDGRRLTIQSDPRTPRYFEDSFDVRRRNPSLRPFVTEHLELLAAATAVVFVLDSQCDRSDEPREVLDRLRRDLAGVGRSDRDLPVVFQCNKRDLQNAAPLTEIVKWVSWPTCELVASVATTGHGVMDALECALTSVSPVSAQPYR